jgi:hypothetical protein
MPDVDKLKKPKPNGAKSTKKDKATSREKETTKKKAETVEDKPSGRQLKDLPPGVYSAAPSLFAKDGESEGQNGSKTEEKPNISRVHQALKGAKVDKSGNVVSSSGTVLGKADGKLSKMVGKKVNWQGEIVDKKGKVLGTVTNITNIESSGATMNAMYERAKESYGIEGDKSIDKFAKSGYKSARSASKDFAKATQSKKPSEKSLFEYGDMKLKMNTDSENVTFSFSLPQQQLQSFHKQLESIVG